MTPPPIDGRVGPLLFLHGHADGRLKLAALVVAPRGERPPELCTDAGAHSPVPAAQHCGAQAWTYRFELPARAGASYSLGDRTFPVMADLSGDLRVAYASCNGQEEGDRERPAEARNAMWAELADAHREDPFALLLLGGDQIYADEIVLAHPLSEGWPETVPEVPAEREPELRAALAESMFARYVELFADTPAGWVMARVPSIAMWDDHDICDGWGSRPVEKLDSAVGRAIFAVAREQFLLFQLGVTAEALPDCVLDRTGTSLGTAFHLPGLHVIAPDLRSERRPDTVMGEHGWAALRRGLDRVQEGRVIVLSSVPALGPRLSLVERWMGFTPQVEKYEDDLRDQWQSRTHRAEWRAFLSALLEVHAREGVAVTVVSGEIHLATRGTMDAPSGPIHQLVASGIAHPPPPRLYARTLGALARLGETPLPDHPIRLRPLPGCRTIYKAQRNFLILERRSGRWSAAWQLEGSGRTKVLDLS